MYGLLSNDLSQKCKIVAFMNIYPLLRARDRRQAQVKATLLRGEALTMGIFTYLQLMV